MIKHIAFFDLDGTLWDNKYEVWIIDKDTPNIPVLVIDPIEFTLMKKGHYRRDKNLLDYNGQKFWISEKMWQKIQKKSKTENIDRFGVSLMPMVSRDLLNKSKIEFLTKNIEHLSQNKDIEIGILTARSNQRTSSDQMNELRLELKNIGLDIKKIFFVGQSVNTGQNYINKISILLEHLIGFKIKSGKFLSLKQDWYPRVDFYDDDPQNIHYANDIQKFFEEILRKTDDEVFHLIVERLDSTKLILKNYLVTTNQTNRFVESTVELKQPVRFPIMENKKEKPKMKYIKEFKEFLEKLMKVNESETETPVKTPVKTPTKTPSPNRPSPIRRDRPAIDPKPKATIDDVVNRVKDVMDDELIEIIKNKYK
jgi:hypothetical protein